MADTNNILSSWNSKKDDTNNIRIKNLEDRVRYLESYAIQDLNTYIKETFLMQRTGKVFTSKFPLFSVSQSSKGIKIDDNADMQCNLSTQHQKNKNDYENEPMFKPIDCNWKLDDTTGKIIITAIDGQGSFSRNGSNGQVGVINMPWYVRTWKDENYWYISVTDSPKANYDLLTECFTPQKENQGFMVHSKYLMGDIGGKPYSASGLIPLCNDNSLLNTSSIKPSFKTLIDYCHKLSSYYCAETNYDLFFIQLQFLIKFANLNMTQALNSAIGINLEPFVRINENIVNDKITIFDSIDMYKLASKTSISGVTNNFGTYTTASTGDDFWYKTISSVNYNDNSINVEDIGNISVASGDGFIIMPWKTGICDNILSCDGCYSGGRTNNVPLLIGGIECFSGGREVLGNVFSVTQDDTTRIIRKSLANKLTSDEVDLKTYSDRIASIPIQGGYISECTIQVAQSFISPLKYEATSSTGFSSTIIYDPAYNQGQVREVICLYNNFWELDLSRQLDNGFILPTGYPDRHSYNIVSRLSPNGMCQRSS